MAQQTLRLYATKWAKTDRDSPSTVIDVSSMSSIMAQRTSGSTGIASYIFTGFEAFPSNLSRNKLYSVHFRVRYKGEIIVGQQDHRTPVRGNVTNSDFDPATLTWINMPENYQDIEFFNTDISQYDIERTIYINNGSFTQEEGSKVASLFLRSKSMRWYPGTAASGYYKQLYLYKLLLDEETPLYAEVVYDDVETVDSQVRVIEGPTSGYKNPRSTTYFSWGLERSSSYWCVQESFTQISAKLFWKKSTDENYTEISISGENQTYTVSANIFPTNSTIQWYIEATDDVGTTSQTEVYSFTTADSYISTTPVRPKDSVEDGSSPITLSWTYTSPNGTTPTGYRIYYKGVNDNEFTVLTDVTGTASTTHTAPANTFPSGEVEWYAMMFNADGIGNADYCTHAKFINYAAPSVPVLSVDQAPYITMNWQSSEQEAYEVQIDDTTYGPYFGTEKSFELPDYLTDGQHTIKLRVLGGYNLWSNWAEMTITVENVPGSDVTLSAQSHIDTELSWETESETPDYLIFRDGKQIARTNKTFFVDRFVLGEHSYYIVNKLSDGNYTKSNEIDAGVILDAMYIALVNGGAWTKIRYNLADQSDAAYEDSIESTYNHLAGDVYPSATLGTYRESNVSLSAVFLYTEEEERKQFEALFGKLVIIKFKDGNVLFGVLDAWSKQARKHYWTGYTFTIRRVEWEDFVDDTD